MSEDKLIGLTSDCESDNEVFVKPQKKESYLIRDSEVKVELTNPSKKKLKKLKKKTISDSSVVDDSAMDTDDFTVVKGRRKRNVREVA